MYVSVTCSLGSTETFSLLSLCDWDLAPHFPGLHHLPNPPFYSPGNDRQTMWRSNSHGLCSRSGGCSANAPVINITFVNCLILFLSKTFSDICVAIISNSACGKVGSFSIPGKSIRYIWWSSQLFFPSWQALWVENVYHIIILCEPAFLEQWVWYWLKVIWPYLRAKVYRGIPEKILQNTVQKRWPFVNRSPQ